MKKELAKIKFLKQIVHAIRRYKFELKCIFDDFFYIVKNWQEIKNYNSNIVFVTSLDFYHNKKWQVASQAILWYKFVEENNAILCGSSLSYLLFFKNKKHIVSLEPKYNAPTINFDKFHDKVIILLSDSHSKQWLPNYLKMNSVTDIITPYRKTLIDTKYADFLKDSHIHSFPWSVPEHLVKNITISQQNDKVLGFGQSGSEVYDLRDWTFNTNLLDTFNYAGSGNYKFKGDDYFKWVRTYDASVVAMSTKKLYNYTVAKYFEIPSQGLLLFAFPSVDLEDFGFKDSENCIFVNKTNFHEKIKEYQSNPQNYLEIRKNGLELIKSKHTINSRLSYLKNLLQEVEND